MPPSYFYRTAAEVKPPGLFYRYQYTTLGGHYTWPPPLGNEESKPPRPCAVFQKAMRVTTRRSKANFLSEFLQFKLVRRRAYISVRSSGLLLVS